MTDEDKPGNSVGSARNKGKGVVLQFVPKDTRIHEKIKDNENLNAMIQELEDRAGKDGANRANYHSVLKSFHKTIEKFYTEADKVSSSPLVNEHPVMSEFMQSLYDGVGALDAIVVLKYVNDDAMKNGQTSGSVGLTHDTLENLKKANEIDGFIGAMDLINQTPESKTAKALGQIIPQEFMDFLRDDRELLNDISKMANDVLDKNKGASR